MKFGEEEPWSVLVITPVMRRAQELLSSSEIIFLDSTSGCESTGSSFTVLVTATKAGGIPIGVLLHPYQTAENYAKAFSLLQKTVKHCFGGREVKHFHLFRCILLEKKNALLSLIIFLDCVALILLLFFSLNLQNALCHLKKMM